MTIPRLPRDDLAAAMAARRELGPDYDDAFVQSIVDRVEETLRDRPKPRPRRDAPGWDTGLVLPLASLLAAIPLSAIAVVNAGTLGFVLCWAAIVLINVVHGASRRG
ncbi:hypothetical protein [Actinomadura flavalba]|uniref:hypothetical protein n=1 Tax=Actinomadura flavalba TaxID=1120938 RepID=UPI00036BE131|nr:hypothetical protein [Actinomadura flavalba]